ncbi:MAG: hypothetical protein ACRC2J_07410, partial [Microcoleaceae cyanobacterium]
YTSNTDGTYSLTANKLPTGGLTNWANTQLGVPGLDKLVTGDADLDLVKTNATDSSKVIKFTGSVDLSKLITAVSGNTSSLVIPSLSSQNPKLTYKTGTTGTIYDFDSETIDVRYEKNTDGSVYDFTAKQLPVGGLTSWVETTLGLKDFSNLVTGTVNIASSKNTTGSKKSLDFAGSVDVSTLVKSFVKTLSGTEASFIPSLKVDNPKLSQEISGDSTTYNFTAGDLLLDYSKKTGGDYTFKLQNLPVGDMTKWLETELGLTNISDFITGKANLTLTPTTKQLSFTGDVDISSLIKAIAGSTDLPVPSLKLTDPAMSYSLVNGQTKYSFAGKTGSGNLQVDYVKKPDGTYTLDVNDLPVGDMVSWADDQLGLDGLDKLATGNLDLS